jgi:hypothetical protein
MAAVTASNVTLLRVIELGDKSSKFFSKLATYNVVLTANGGTAGDIPASLFGMTKINLAICCRAIDNALALSTLTVVIETGDAGILVCDPENATDATRGNPTNYTGSMVLTLIGY